MRHSCCPPSERRAPPDAVAGQCPPTDPRESVQTEPGHRRPGPQPTRCWRCARCGNAGSCHWSPPGLLPTLPPPQIHQDTCRSCRRSGRSRHGEQACTRLPRDADGPPPPPSGLHQSDAADAQSARPRKTVCAAAAHRSPAAFQSSRARNGREPAPDGCRESPFHRPAPRHRVDAASQSCCG